MKSILPPFPCRIYYSVSFLLFLLSPDLNMLPLQLPQRGHKYARGGLLPLIPRVFDSENNARGGPLPLIPRVFFAEH